MTKFSIITPVYNTEKFLPTCIKSVLKQDFKDFEFILINDGSTDNSTKILKKYQKIDSRIKVITKENEGQGVARNIALKQATGDYVLYLDSDDRLEPDALSKLYKKFQEDNYDIIFFNVYRYIETSNKKFKYMFNNNFYKKFGENVFNTEQAGSVLFETNGLPFKAFNRNFLIENKIQYSPTKFIEDSEFYIKAILYAKKMVCLNDFILNYRVTPNSSTSKAYLNIDVIEKTFYVCEKIFNDYYQQSKNQVLLEEFILNRFAQLFYHFSRINKLWYKIKYYNMMKRLAIYMNNKYGLDSIQKNSYRLFFKLILENNFIKFTFKRRQLLIKLHLYYYFDI